MQHVLVSRAFSSESPERGPGWLEQLTSHPTAHTLRNDEKADLVSLVRHAETTLRLRMKLRPVFR